MKKKLEKFRNEGTRKINFRKKSKKFSEDFLKNSVENQRESCITFGNICWKILVEILQIFQRYLFQKVLEEITKQFLDNF